ncbi:unnamed protein product [Darwinula stevensoni]|uniref:poly(ADP-ribose) glycohydrolase n=1 Tax=Darwinula stevensoni TaxID=69355 RepID=A0A7R9A5F8_9CRUS|nr:unnamed protein product [Darwinula stevensoni]CAG0885225.1 unnamed protein product [Darwinula stevensoni]
MALVLLPCDLPSWQSTLRHLQDLKHCRDTSNAVELMKKIYSISCVSLDPEDNEAEEMNSFEVLKRYLKSLPGEEERRFVERILPAMAEHALRLKERKPPFGLRYSLQQHDESIEVDRRFLVSILAACFFSCFPKRTPKTHPTLQDCNFAPFFRHLDCSFQQVKLRCVLALFDDICFREPPGVHPQVMPVREHLSIEDWESSGDALCPLIVRNQGQIESAESIAVQTVFGSPGIGGRVLFDAANQESTAFVTQPELLASLCFVENLEDNEAMVVVGFQPSSTIYWDPYEGKWEQCPRQPVPVRLMVYGGEVENGRRGGERMERWRTDGDYEHPQADEETPPLQLSIIDAEDFSECPLSQYEDIWILRELNKALTGFQQSPVVRRLPPIGQSRSSSPETKPSPEPPPCILLPSRNSRLSPVLSVEVVVGKSRVCGWGSRLIKMESVGSDKDRETLNVLRPSASTSSGLSERTVVDSEVTLGDADPEEVDRSSEEDYVFTLPRPWDEAGFSQYETCGSSDSPEYVSAHGSFEEDEPPREDPKRGKKRRRGTFAERLEEALLREAGEVERPEPVENPHRVNGDGATRINGVIRGFPEVRISVSGTYLKPAMEFPLAGFPDP